MRRLLQSLLAILLIWSPVHAKSADAGQPRIDAKYSEAVTLFATMDNVSDWWTGFVEPAYRQDWTQRFGWSAEDEEWVKRYSEYRHRTYSDPSQNLDLATSPDGLFASAIASSSKTDPLASYMVSQESIEAALDGLEAIASPQDAAMLLGFYQHFEPKWRVVLKESVALAEHATKLQGEFSQPQVDAFIERIAGFYGVGEVDRFQVFFTRFPVETRSRAEIVAGNVLLLHAPKNWSYENGGWDEIVAHEIVHHISARQDPKAKRLMSDRFLSICPVERASRRLWMLEEPLAVAVGQAAFSQMVRGRKLDQRSNWYANPWIDITARLIAGSVVDALSDGVALRDSGIVEEAAQRCATLTFISQKM